MNVHYLRFLEKKNKMNPRLLKELVFSFHYFTEMFMNLLSLCNDFLHVSISHISNTTQIPFLNCCLITFLPVWLALAQGQKNEEGEWENKMLLL